MHRGGVSGDMLLTQDNEKLFSYDDLSLLGPQIYCTDLKIAHHGYVYYPRVTAGWSLNVRSMNQV